MASNNGSGAPWPERSPRTVFHRCSERYAGLSISASVVKYTVTNGPARPASSANASEVIATAGIDAEVSMSRAYPICVVRSHGDLGDAPPLLEDARRERWSAGFIETLRR